MVDYFLKLFSHQGKGNRGEMGAGTGKWYKQAHIE
jgi:hypothetical protein